jgi:hypothetical protein
MRSSLATFSMLCDSDEASRFLSESRQSVLNEAGVMSQLRRDDYKEFVQLCVMFLDTSEEDTLVSFNEPGTLNKARWLSKLLYSLELCLLEDDVKGLPRVTVTTRNQAEKIREFVNFVTLIYCSCG